MDCDREKKCLFYLHNTFENNHYALVSFIRVMKDQNIRYSFAAKRFLKNRLSEIWNQDACYSIQQIPVWDEFWHHFDFFHAVYDGNPSLALCMSAYMFNVPYILSFHGGYDTNYKIFLPEMKEKIRCCVLHSRYTTVVCKTDRNSLIRLGCSAEKIVLAPPAIDFSILPAHGKSVNTRIALVGRFVAKKGIDVAIRALQLLPPAYSLDLIGDGELKNELYDLASKLKVQNRIRWHGELPLQEALNIVAEDFFFWHPARKAPDGNAEGIPQILIYALALERACISTNSGHISDLLQNKEGGILVEQDSPELLADATLNFFNIIHAPYTKALIQQYGIEEQLKNWENIYQLKTGSRRKTNEVI